MKEARTTRVMQRTNDFHGELGNPRLDAGAIRDDGRSPMGIEEPFAFFFFDDSFERTDNSDWKLSARTATALAVSADNLKSCIL